MSTVEVRGLPASGRIWKTLQTEPNCKMYSTRPGWEKRQLQRKKDNILKLIKSEKSMEIAENKKQDKEQKEARRIRKEENERKAEVLQKVSDAKYRRMNRRQQKVLKKSK